MSRKPKHLDYVPMYIDGHDRDEILDFTLKLKTSIPCALGHYQLLWSYTGRHYIDGHLPAMIPAKLARICMWKGDPYLFVNALFECKWLTKHCSGEGWWVENWDEQVAPLLRLREIQLERRRAIRLKTLILERDQYKCRYCAVLVKPSTTEIDHVFPISKGGKSTLNNLVVSCRACNQKKGAEVLP